MDNTHLIVLVRGHYEVYDSNGNFILDGDTWDECCDKLINMLVVDARSDGKIKNRKLVIA